jgi:hypothetical protein
MDRDGFVLYEFLMLQHLLFMSHCIIVAKNGNSVYLKTRLRHIS